MRKACLLFVALLCAACGGGGESDPEPLAGASALPDAGADAAEAPDAEPPPACGSANRPLAEGLATLFWDDGTADSNLREKDYEIDADGDPATGEPYVLNEVVVHEAVRFELEHPAKIHGFAVQWAAIGEGAAENDELVAGLYGDFGHNGFDFWAPDPLFTGSRCVEDHAPGEWLTYVFDEPIAVEHPGLVYVAHRAEPGAPVFSFDAEGPESGSCEAWDDCHSAMNLPEAETAQYYGGLSFPFSRDYLVRLHVDYEEDPAPPIFVAPGELPAASHASFGDYDADGWDDLLTDGPRLYRNVGGTFSDATEASGIAALALSATGGVFGDYDGDGCLDVFLYAESVATADTLLRSNCDGTFSDATAAAGIVDEQHQDDCGGDPLNIRSPTAAAAWIDVDADGRLDLYLANFICWTTYTYYRDTVYRNAGAGVFEPWPAGSGFSSLETASRGAAPIDADSDGDVDLYVNNYVLQRNLFFDNDGDGTVTERALSNGLSGDGAQGYFGHTIGAAWGDLDGDGDFDLVAANLAHPRFFDFSDKTEVLLQGPSGTFTDIAGDWAKPVSAAGLRYQETHSVPALGDFDHDGALDLVITAVYDGRPTDFYWGNGDGTFRLDSYHAGITTENGWGVALADVDHDGDLDVFAGTLFLNELPDERKGHWLEVGVIGNVGANRSGVGASVRVVAGGVTRMRHVQGGTGKGGQDSQTLHFGLGAESSVESISVSLPGGKKVDFAGPFAADQRVWVREDGTSATGFAPPP